MFVVRKLFLRQLRGRLRKRILRDISLSLVVGLALAFVLIINVTSVLVRPLWFG
jgi:hypothetical protein